MVNFRLTFGQNSNSVEYFQLGLACADMCSHIKRMIGEVELDNLSWSSRQAIGGLTMRVKSVLHGLDNSPTVLLTVESLRRSE